MPARRPPPSPRRPRGRPPCAPADQGSEGQASGEAGDEATASGETCASAKLPKASATIGIRATGSGASRARRGGPQPRAPTNARPMPIPAPMPISSATRRRARAPVLPSPPLCGRQGEEREQDRHADAVVQAALDVQALGAPVCRHDGIRDHRLAERRIGRREHRGEDRDLQQAQSREEEHAGSEPRAGSSAADPIRSSRSRQADEPAQHGEVRVPTRR